MRVVSRRRLPPLGLVDQRLRRPVSPVSPPLGSPLLLVRSAKEPLHPADGLIRSGLCRLVRGRPSCGTLLVRSRPQCGLGRGCAVAFGDHVARVGLRGGRLLRVIARFVRLLHRLGARHAGGANTVAGHLGEAHWVCFGAEGRHVVAELDRQTAERRVLRINVLAPVPQIDRSGCGVRAVDVGDGRSCGCFVAGCRRTAVVRRWGFAGMQTPSPQA